MEDNEKNKDTVTKVANSVGKGIVVVLIALSFVLVKAAIFTTQVGLILVVPAFVLLMWMVLKKDTDNK